MHVLILNQTFYPDFAATAQLMWDLAQHLDRHGHQITALCSRTIYGTDQQHEKTYERIGNIHIHRVTGTSFGKKHLLGRLSDFASFYLAAFWQLQHLPRPDVILALTTPPMIGTLGMLQRQFQDASGGRRVRLVQHIMDLYPDAAVALGVLKDDSLPHRIMARLTRRNLETSDAIIVLGRDMAERVIHGYALEHLASRIHIVPPWSDASLLTPLDRSNNPLAASLGLRDTFNIVYSGNLGLAHDVDTLTAAIDQMRSDPGIVWLFIGGGKRFDQLKDHAARANWTHVRFLPYQDREALNHSLNLADVHLVSQLPAFTGIVVPSKLYGILAVGKPSIMVGPADAECSRVIEEHACGYVVPNGQANQLVAHLRHLRANPELCRTMGHRARLAFEQHYDCPIACNRIERILESVVNDR